jgi:polar amino acid transport system substrate-binding protein
VSGRMRRTSLGALSLLIVAALAGRAEAESGSVAKELAPTGKLRVGIAIAPSPSAFFAVKGEDGKPRGVSVALGTALAEKLGVPVEFVVYPNSGALTEAAESGTWDVSFMPVDDERRKKVEFVAAYNRFDSTYLVRAGSPVQTLAELDKEGVRLLGVETTTTIRAAQRSLKVAKVTPVRTVDEAVELIRTGKADAVALSRNTLLGLAAKLPGTRILEGHFHATSTAVAVPKSRAAALTYVSAFVEEAKASGLVRRAFDDVGLKDAIVAEPGAR